ncbi:hypothetical protein [Enterovibrio norvegicus]|uniref:hypothetical protein n=1 Tax=Enterovibrio norvegicus TaxID=188144 RepID=UPI000C8217FF|nr:hypothetical protein [Enterovibrio norvegicus]PMH60050.1 hypothetical protein BCU62_21760 [Enterovibrio norvegicus]
MSGPFPAKDTNNVIDDLLALLGTRDQLSEFEKALFTRKANTQSSAERKYTLLALMHTIDGNRGEARNNALLALDYIEQPASLNHAIFVFQANGFGEELIDTIDKFLGDSSDLFISKALMPGIVAFPNIGYIETVHRQLQNMQLQECAKDAFDMCEYFLSNSDKAQETFGIESDTVNQISLFVSSITSSFGGVVVNKATFDLSPSGDWMSLVYHVEPGEFDIVDLNLELADKMIEHELDSLPLVARFDLIPGNIRKVRYQYAD